MRAAVKNSPTKKPPLPAFLENVLLLMVLGLIALRATYIENPHIEQIQTRFFLTSEIISLFLSTVLLGCFALWLFVSLAANQFHWRKTCLGLAAGLFVLAGVISCLAASNKRAALTDVILLASPMVSAMFLIQLLATRQKIRMALVLILAVGVAATAQCIDQLTESNKALIQEYEHDPAAQLQTLGIETDSLEHWMYEHRLYSRDIRGFLMTGNSAASFFLLASFAAAGLCVEAFGGRKNTETLAALVCYGLAFLFAAGGLVMTHSKGGNGAFIIGITLFAVVGFFGKWLWKYRILIGILLLIGIVLASAALVAYGCKHGRLPGGNSMLVRWQYWQSAAAMIGDHLLTGVGGGNFSFWYPLYKNPAASETVQDPHCLILSLLCQYGPLGLAAFLAAILRPMYKSLGSLFAGLIPLPQTAQPTNKKLWMGLLAVSICLLLFIRPALVDTDFLYESADVSSAAYVILYLFPAGVFAMAFGLLSAVSTGDVSIQGRNYYLTLAVVCGLAAVLIHNLIDFAIFEPGVWNTFWLFVAILAATVHTNSPQDDKPILLSAPKRLLMLVGLIAVIVGYLAIAVIPPVKANRLFSRALKPRELRHDFLDQAIAADPLSPDTAYNAAGVLMRMYSRQRPLVKDSSLLEKAIDLVNIAQQRNPANFKPCRLKGDIYLQLAAQAKSERETSYLQKAYETFSEALVRYPGSDRLHYTLGQAAEELNQPQHALAHYQKAVQIELDYQAQFKIMYPGRDPVISRLGNTAFTVAKAKIEELQKQIGAGKNPSNDTRSQGK